LHNDGAAQALIVPTTLRRRRRHGPRKQRAQTSRPAIIALDTLGRSRFMAHRVRPSRTSRCSWDRWEAIRVRTDARPVP